LPEFRLQGLGVLTEDLTAYGVERLGPALVVESQESLDAVPSDDEIDQRPANGINRPQIPVIPGRPQEVPQAQFRCPRVLPQGVPGEFGGRDPALRLRPSLVEDIGRISPGGPELIQGGMTQLVPI